METNNTPALGRVYIGFSGRRNVDKPNVSNAITSRNLAVVFNARGTIMDLVYRAMELLPLGLVTMIDTPEIDDGGELSSLRVRKSYQMLNRTSMIVLAMDHCHGMTPKDGSLLKRIEEKQIPYVIVCNKMSLEQKDPRQVDWKQNLPLVKVSVLTGQGTTDLKKCLTTLGEVQGNSRRIVGDLLEPQDFAVLVVPIDEAASKERLILSQQQTIRDILEADATAIVLKESGLVGVLPALGKKSKMVITDSQTFARVSAGTPEDIPLTPFSIFFAGYKGDLEQLAEDVTALDHIGKGDRILVLEGCIHHRQYGNISTVKLPPWIQGFTGTESEFVFTSGAEFPDDLDSYCLIVHYSGCMLNEREIKYRMKCARDQCVPVTNYGITITYIHGILRRGLESFPHIATLLDRKGMQAKMKGNHKQ